MATPRMLDFLACRLAVADRDVVFDRVVENERPLADDGNLFAPRFELEFGDRCAVGLNLALAGIIQPGEALISERRE